MDLPSCFPSELAPRALAVYTFLRCFSRVLRLSPFKVRSKITFKLYSRCFNIWAAVLSVQTNGFLVAIAVRLPSLLLDECHFALLRILEPVRYICLFFRSIASHMSPKIIDYHGNVGKLVFEGQLTTLLPRLVFIRHYHMAVVRYRCSSAPRSSFR
jgi:hypothetical protein